MEIRDLADELQAILDGERPRLSKAEMREYMECLRAFAPIAAQDEAVLEIGECAEVIWHQGGPCQLPPGAKLYPRSEPKYIEEIAEALGDPTLISLSQVATGIRDLKAERARVPDGWRIQVDGDRVHVTKPDGAVAEWHKRPATNGSGMYDLCRALAAPSQPVERSGVPEARTWITAHSATRSDIVAMLREEAHEREQYDETAGVFADLAGANLLAAIANALEDDALWAVAAPSPPKDASHG